MLEIHRIPVATPYPCGPTNCYLIKSDPYTLLDTGPYTDKAKNTLIEGLMDLDVEISDIRRVVLSHGHLDHSGLAQWLHNLSGAQILCHRLEERKIRAGYDFHQERFTFYQEAGLPTDRLFEILSDFDPVEKNEPLEEEIHYIDEGDLLSFSQGEMLVKHLPGHSDGHICLYDQEEQRFLCGDFLLKRITPNPCMEPDSENFALRLPTLSQYMDGLAMLEELQPRILLPGHGDSIDNSMSAVEKAYNHHRSRLDLVYAALQGNSMTLYQLMRTLYPDIFGFNIYLGISEVFAHVDYLVAQGKVYRQTKEAVSFYYT